MAAKRDKVPPGKKRRSVAKPQKAMTRAEVNARPAVAPALAKWRSALTEMRGCAGAGEAGGYAAAGGAVRRAKEAYVKAVRGLRVTIVEVPGVA